MKNISVKKLQFKLIPIKSIADLDASITISGSECYTRETGVIPLDVSVNAKALKLLIEGALRGPRLYELIHLTRPGDILHYLWFDFDKMPSSYVKFLQGRIDSHCPWLFFDINKNMGSLPVLLADELYPYQYEDTDTETGYWLAFRADLAWMDLLNTYFAIVKQFQNVIRSSNNTLITRVLRQVDSGHHAYDYLAKIERHNEIVSPRLHDQMTEKVICRIVTIVKEMNIETFAAEERGEGLWLALCELQLERAGRNGTPLRMFSSDAGVPFDPLSIGCDIHVSCEGMVIGELTVLPTWREFNKYKAEENKSLQAGLGGYQFNEYPECRILISQIDFGVIKGFEKETIGNWYIYGSRH